MRSRLAGSLVVLVALAAASARAGGGGVTLRLSADPGDVSRTNAPVTATLKVGGELSAEQVAGLGARPVGTLKSAGGGPVPVQVQVIPGPGGEPEAVSVGWVTAKLEAGKVAEYDLTLEPGVADDADGKDTATNFRFVGDQRSRRLVQHGYRFVYEYMTAYDPADREATYKPYHHVYGSVPLPAADDTPGTRPPVFPLITKGPGGQYTHHRGLYVGWNKTQTADGKSYDFWHCPDVTQRHTGYRDALESTGLVFARAVSTTDWADADGKPVVQDTRDVTAWDVGKGATLLDFVITLSSAAGPLRLDGDPQHAGFQFRAAEEVQEGKTTYVRPEGAKGTGNDVWENCAWVAGLFKVQGQPYAVVHMDHPDNPRPTVYSTRDYGRFGPFFAADLKPGEPIRLRYRILVLDAEKHADTSAAAFAEKYRDFATPVRVTAAKPQ